MAQSIGLDCREGSVERPFEWLTSPASLKPILLAALDQPLAITANETFLKANQESSRDYQGEPQRSFSNVFRAMHIGSGNSALGEYILQQKHLCRQNMMNECTEVSGLDAIECVYNVDRDAEALRQTRDRWREYCTVENVQEAIDKLQCIECDFVKRRIECPDASMDLIIDKSTLDCTMCSQGGTASLMCEVYRLLKHCGGVYLVISFHDVKLLMPMLRDCPGADWEVTHTTMQREVEMIGSHLKGSQSIVQDNERRELLELGIKSEKNQLNVFFCRRRGQQNEESPTFLDPENVEKHIQEVSNEFYQSSNPLLTPQRRIQINAEFGAREVVPLEDAYQILFTPLERDHLEFQDFLDDWRSYCSSYPGIPKGSLSVETAFAFLNEMQ